MQIFKKRNRNLTCKENETSGGQLSSPSQLTSHTSGEASYDLCLHSATGPTNTAQLSRPHLTSPKQPGKRGSSVAVVKAVTLLLRRDFFPRPSSHSLLSIPVLTFQQTDSSSTGVQHQAQVRLSLSHPPQNLRPHVAMEYRKFSLSKEGEL